MKTKKDMKMRLKEKDVERKTTQKRVKYFGLVILVISLLIINLNFVSADVFGGGDVPSTFMGGTYQVYGSSVNPQFNQPGFSLGSGINPRDYWGNFNREDCRERQDIILTIPPGGCSPAVVRSDLLEEQNVPVFCKVSSIQVNPLIDITKIRSIRFKGEYPPGVSGISYYPARAAVRSTNRLIGSPVVDNVGYLVIILKRTVSEQDMPDWLEGNITAVIDYDSEGAFGVGQHDFFLEEMKEDEWQREYKDYGFWKGKGFVRLDSISGNSARVSIYRDATYRETSINLVEGQTSGDIYLGGSYCAAGMNIKLQEIGYPVDTVLLKVDDEEFWIAEGGRFLDGKCRVKSLDPSEVGGGRVRLSCTGAGSFELMLNPPSVFLTGGIKEDEKYSIGDKIKTSGDENIYLSYVGMNPKANSNYAVLIKTTEEQDVFLERGLSIFIARTAENYLNDPKGLRTLKLIMDFKLSFETYLEGKIKNYAQISKENIVILEVDDKWEGIKFVSIFSKEALSEENQDLVEYYNKAIESYNDVFELYPFEREENSKSFEPYGAKALDNAAKLSEELGLQGEQIKYLEKLIENYPSTNLSNYAEAELVRAYKGRISKDSQAIVYVNNEPYFISIKDMKKPGYEDLGAKILFTTDKGIKEIKMKKDVMELTPGGDNIKIPIKILEITDDSIVVEYFPKGEGVKKHIVNKLGEISVGEGIVGKKITLEIGKTLQLTEEINVKLVKTNLNKQVRIKIIPKAFGTRTESDFHFKIGIEKRAIKLSPEKTQEMVDNLDEQIKDWNEINDKLGKVVKGMKGACFATSAMLTVRNFFSGMSGASMARNELMTASGGWNEKCEITFANKEDACGKGIPSSIADCLLNCNDYINSDVETLTERYQSINSDMEGIQNRLGPKSSDPLDFAGSVNPDDVKKEYCKVLKQKYTYDGNMKVFIRGEGEISLSNIVSKQEFDDCKMSLQNMKDLIAYSGLTPSGYSVLQDVGRNSLGQSFGTTYMINQITRNEGVLKDIFGVNAPVRTSDKKAKYQVMADTKDLGSEYALLDSDSSKYFTDIINGKEVLIGLKQKQRDIYVVNQVLDSEKDDISNDPAKRDANGNKISYKDYYSDYEGIKEFTLANPGMYQNPIKIVKGEPLIKYYSRAPYKGLPAQVPFDQRNGWYVTTDYILSGFGKPYEQSGRAINFWICNVGKNGLIEGKERDDCRYYNLGSSADLDFPGLSKSKSATLVRDAENALREASRRYGDKSVRINDAVYDTGITDGGESGRCSDFMSPGDCHLMFNVCDPVICPESRCDFGGAYRVSNVVQSGIIGSLLLCLPNAQEGIAIPICLSGVHAGLDSYISILNSTQACLQESLDTGRNIGICDEVKSIYMCEFFWRQAVPLMDVFIPRLFEMSLGQGTRGGGEYATVDHAWQNMQGSIDYFKDQYAVNAVKAFSQRSTEGVGTEVCKMFVSARYPNSKEFFDNLVEPDSPVQFTGWFSENVLNEATTPPTSHYKVYYHIYAGKDIGANYVVYLKNPPQSAYISTMFSYVVDRGFIPKGGQVDEARDFTSVSGYQELCININGQEECGFKQVSTSWAIDELSNRYAEEQASQTDIDSAEECVAGSPSLWSFAQPNLEAGAQEALNPELYKRGVIRVCSKGNPGAQVEADVSVAGSKYDRWKRVGYCDEASGIGCWMDTNSVKDVLRDAPNLTEKVLDEVDLNYIEKVEDMYSTESDPVFKKADELKGQISEWTDFSKENIDNKVTPIIDKLIDVGERGYLNDIKAKALFLIGKIYHEVTRKIFEKSDKGVVISGGSDGDEGEDVETEFKIEDNRIIIYNKQSLSDNEIENYLTQWGSAYGYSFELIDTDINIAYFDLAAVNLKYEIVKEGSNIIIEIGDQVF